MERSYRKGQSLIETLIITLMLTLFFITLETCHEKIKPRYQHYKVNQRAF